MFSIKQHEATGTSTIQLNLPLQQHSDLLIKAYDVIILFPLISYYFDMFSIYYYFIEKMSIHFCNFLKYFNSIIS
jgi:hypothetical protein